MRRKKHDGLHFGEKKKKFNFSILKEIFVWMMEMAIVAIMAYVFVYYFGLRISAVGRAMTPTVSNEEQILINRFTYIIGEPSRNDVIVFLPNGNTKSHYYIRRVVGIPGDTVQIKDGILYINGTEYQGNNKMERIEEPGIAENEIKLAYDEYFVLGDNPNNSEDSRHPGIGYVKKEYMIGKAWFHFQSFEEMGRIR